MWLSGHFRSSETKWRLQLFPVASDPGTAGATPVFLFLGGIHLRAHDRAYVHIDFVLNIICSLSQRPFHSLRSRCDEAQRCVFLLRRNRIVVQATVLGRASQGHSRN